MEKRGKRNTISIEEFDRKLQKLIREVQSEGRHGTANNYRHTRSSFFRFIQEPNTEFSLDAPTVERYEQWLRSRGVSRNSSSFYMRNLRAMCNLLFKRGAIADAELFADVYTGIAKTRKRAVSEQTLARIKQADLTEFPQLARCRDLFLFCFYCRGLSETGEYRRPLHPLHTPQNGSESRNPHRALHEGDHAAPCRKRRIPLPDTDFRQSPKGLRTVSFGNLHIQPFTENPVATVGYSCPLLLHEPAYVGHNRPLPANPVGDYQRRDGAQLGKYDTHLPLVVQPASSRRGE